MMKTLLAQPHRKGRFTLIEILAVICLISVLAGITIGVIPIVAKRQGDAKTQGILKSIQIGLESYKEKYGYYPVMGSSNPSPFFLDRVSGGAADNSTENIKNNFCQFIDYDKLKKDAVSVTFGGVTAPAVVDGYGTVIIYRYPGYFNRGGYDLGSCGQDMKIGDFANTTIDVNAIQKLEEGNKLDTCFQNNFGKEDDITNFKRPE